MDLDGDRHDDIITGSYWPGHVYLFRGKSDGSYAKGEVLEDSAGRKLLGSKPWQSEQTPDMDSLAAAPHAADLDGDGDYDLLLGNIAGRVIFKENLGSTRAPKFAADGRALQAGGADIKVEGDAGPICADWNQDGLLDLIVGSGDGAVWCFLNTGTRTAPSFAAGSMLLSAAKHDWQNLPREGEEPTGHGLRTKVCVTDYTGDRRLDLLVGDYVYFQTPAPVLSPEQVRERDALREEQAELSGAYRRLTRDEGQAESAEAKALREKMSQLYAKLQPLEPQGVSHGFVWLYARKAPVTAARD